MLTQERLVELYRELRDQDVLSVYIDGDRHDPAERTAWSRALTHRLDDERDQLEASSPDSLPDFDAARARIMEAVSAYTAFLPDRGWVAFATSTELCYAETVPVPMPHLIRWEKGIRVAPYVRGLKQERVVAAGLVDRRKARLFTYRDGELEDRADLIADLDFGDLSDIGVGKRAGTHTGSRGQTGTEAAQALLDEGAAKLHARVIEILGDLAGNDGLVVLGGTPELVAALGRRAGHFGDRLIERPSMHMGMSDADVKTAVEEAASEVSRRLQGGLLAEVVDLARAGGKGSLGAAATQSALREGRVDTLLLSRGFRQRDPDLADRCVGSAFEQSSKVEELSGEDADRLDSEGEGIGARLRYTVQG